MPASVLRNTKPIPGVVGIEIAGDTATVEVERGSELDGLLYYNATCDGRPRLNLKPDGSDGEAFGGRFIIESLDGSKYKLHARKNLET